jgi:phosphoglycerol transferase
MTILLTSLLAITGVFLASYSSKIKTIILCLIGLNLFLFCLYYAANQFSQAGINNAVFAHLHHLIRADVLLRFWPTVLGLTSALTIIVFSAAWLSKTARSKSLNTSIFISRVASLLLPLLVLIGLAINPFNIDIAAHYHQQRLDQQFPYPEQFENTPSLAPGISYTSPRQKPNFVIIFAESLERAFLNNTNYPGLTPNLNKLISQHGVEVQGIQQTPISAWTDSGLIAALCGIALTPNYSGQNLAEHDRTAQIIARTKATNIIGETCIGDILALDGYSMSFIGGSEFGVQEKELHMKYQGFESVYSTKDISASQQRPEPMSKWGSFDDALFDFAGQQFEQERDTPFGVVILTVDTHTPGYLAPSCRSNLYLNGEDSLLNAVHCSDQLISKFVKKLMASPEHKNTTIFVTSDHLYPGHLPNINQQMLDRDNLFVVFNSRAPMVASNRIISREATNLDSAPTILAHLGYDIASLNFGRNLMRPAPTLVESMGYETFSKHIAKIRAKMNDHWKQNNDTLTPSQGKKTSKSSNAKPY